MSKKYKGKKGQNKKPQGAKRIGKSDPFGLYHQGGGAVRMYEKPDKFKESDYDKKEKRLSAKQKKKMKRTKEASEEYIKSVPRSLIYTQGKIGTHLQNLQQDLRTVMLPYTAENARITKHMKFRDLIKLSQQIYLSHFMAITLGPMGPLLTMMRVPHGPTIQFRIQSYSLIEDVSSFLKSISKPVVRVRPHKHTGASKHQGDKDDHELHQYHNKPPMVVLNHFNNVEGHMKLVGLTFQHMFPSIDVSDFDAEDRRVVLFEYDEDRDLVEFRHYAVKVNEEKEEEKNKDENITASTSLVEIGPRMSLSLIKIEKELRGGEVLYHRYVEKTSAEKKMLEKRAKDQAKQRFKRRREQEANVEAKQQEREERVKAQIEKARARFEDEMQRDPDSDEEEIDIHQTKRDREEQDDGNTRPAKKKKH
mmetsp:Transcript_3450/g.5082  ORF Transcript_3450/g.5082 Transcript_3450/m.5082 type:complete len:420 (-) Transcript_3450:12-1271(-)